MNPLERYFRQNEGRAIYKWMHYFAIYDRHTSYWEEFGGGFRRPGTFVEYAKGLVDQLNAWHSRDGALIVDDFTRTTRSVHWYDSIVVFEKGTVTRPHSEISGATSS